MLNRSFDPVAALASVVGEERERIARLWSKRLRLELSEVEARSSELRAPMLELISELARLLRDRGEDAVRLWPEVVRSLGVDRYELRYEPEDLSRELKSLQQVLLRVYVRRRGTLEPEIAELIADLIGEASAAVHASYARVLRTEEVRLRDTALMESLIEHIDVGIVLAEEDGRISYATPPVSRVLGLPARVLIGSSGDATRTVLAQLHARHLDGQPFRLADLPFVRALKDKRSVKGAMMAIDRLSDGREAVLELNAIPVRQEGTDALYGVVMTLVDRTETTQRARELTHAYDQLRQLQGRLLQRTRAQALGQLASGAAHNLNNFLNVMRLRLTLLRREFKPEYLDALDRTVNNITELVARLQDFAMHRSEEELVPASLQLTIDEGLGLVRPELESANVQLEVDIALEGDPLCRFDPVSLRELLVNLTLSGRSRMPEGGTLTVRGRQAEGWVELSFEDTGPALDQDELIRVFDPLKGKAPAPQLTLLLAVGRNQVQQWGGELWCENRPDGQGAVFRLRMPIVQPAEQEVKPSVAEERAARAPVHTRRVLVVDDEPDNARMMAQLLTEEGYEVCVATTGEEAMQMWSASQFEAALLDALLPDRSGWAVAREIRQQNPNALVAMVTGADVRGQNRDSLALVDAVFRKPIDPDALDDFLSQARRDLDEPEEEKTMH